VESCVGAALRQLTLYPGVGTPNTARTLARPLGDVAAERWGGGRWCRWKELADKSKFEALAAKDKLRAQTELKAYQAAGHATMHATMQVVKDVGEAGSEEASGSESD
jgi:hypothetical protein